MKYERIGPAREGEAGDVSLPANTPAAATTAVKKQAKRTKVSGDLGPIHLLNDPPPRVVVERGEGRSIVTVENRPWGMLDPTCEFFGSGRAADKYALQLAMMIRASALREHERRERLKDAKLREREGSGQ